MGARQIALITWLSALPLAGAYAEAMPPSPEAPVVIFDGGGVPILDLINPETEDAPVPSAVARAQAPVPVHVPIFPVVTRRGGPGTLTPNPQRPARPAGLGRAVRSPSSATTRHRTPGSKPTLRGCARSARR